MQKIDSSIPVPKYYQIFNNMKEMISNGKYRDGDKLDKCRDLAKYFETTSLTINQALGLLEKENLIKRIQGKGIFVSKQQKVSCEKTPICTLMTINGDFHGNLFSSLISNLEKENCNVTIKDLDLFKKMLLWEKEEKFKEIFSEGPLSFILDASYDFPFKLLYDFGDRINQLIFVNRFQTKLSFSGANAILADYHEAGFLAGKHLLKKGAEDIVFITSGYPTGGKKLSLDPELSFTYEIHEGINQAVKQSEEKQKISTHQLFEESEDFEEKFKKIFIKKKLKYIVCAWDFLALSVYRLAAKYKLEIGKDIFVVSILNTPWSEKIFPALTSVCMNEDEIGRLAAKAVKENWKGKIVKVKPELIKRESA